MMRYTLLLLLLPSLAFATGTPSVSGTVSTGEELIITTSGSFGTKLTPAPEVWEDLSDSAYSSLADGDVVPTTSGGYGHPLDAAAPWANMDSSYPEASTVYETSSENIRVSGRPVYSITGGRGSINSNSFLTSDYLFVDYWFYSESAISFPVNVDGDPQGAIQTKLMRFWPDANKTYGHISPYPGRLSYDRGPTSLEKGRVYGGLYPVEGEWTHISVWTDGSGTMSEGGSEGIVKMWSDNILVFNVSDLGLLTGGVAGGASAYTYFALIGIDPIDRGGHIGKKNFMGDIYVDTTQARVVLADRSSWAEVRHYEMQIPSAWAAGEITVTCNVGSFEGGDTVYLFVVDSDGVVSSRSQALTVDGTPPLVTIKSPDELRATAGTE